jgi:hypothetical protein
VADTAIRTVVKLDASGNMGGQPTPEAESVRWFIQRQLEEMKRFRTHTQITTRLDNCLRLREGQYSADQHAAILKFGGSDVFARLTTNKIRGGAALLRSIFIQGERPWEIRPTPVPTLPDDVSQDIDAVVQSEVQTLTQQAQEQGTPPPSAAQIKRRKDQLMKSALSVARKEADADAKVATRYIDDILVEGGFYPALNDFILDFCTMPYACMKGPQAIMTTTVDYVNGKPQRVRKPILRYMRVDPYDIMWSPGSTCMENADLIERIRMSRADLTALIGLPGYDDNAIRSVIRQYGMTGHRYQQFFEPVRNKVQNTEDIFYNTLIDVLAYTGKVSGAQLIEWDIPVPEGDVLDQDMEYSLQAWVCGEFVLKVQVDPDPSNRPCYYAAAYEPCPGSIAGTALPELINDIQEPYNASLRALVNNIAVASGPQVGVNTTRWDPPADGQVRIQPWMIWRFESDPTATAGEKPIEFYQPSLLAGELINTLQFFQGMADEISGIPRYLTGSDKLGGAGRTSSGLSMLMNNATRTATSVAGGIDQNVIEPLLRKTYDLVLLTTGTEILRGDEEIAPRGATYAETRENDRMRMIEAMQATANPYDMAILGTEGRAKMLRVTFDSLMKGEGIVPSEEDMQARAAAEQQQARLAGGQPSPDGQPPQGGQPPQPGAPQQEKDPRNEAASATDNNMRARSPKAIQRATGAAA